MALRFPLISDEKYEATVTFSAVQSSMSSGGGNTLTTSNKITAGDSGALSRGGSGGSKEITNSAGDVILYIPPGISFSDGVGYENTNLGILGSTAADAIARGSGENGVQKTIDKLSSTIDNFRENAFKNLTGLAATKSVAIKAGAGLTANPHTRSVFRDVALRQFSFAFAFLPASREEALEAEKIVKFFRTNLYPDEIPGGATYKFPTKFNIGFKYKGDRIAHRLLPCYLTSVQTAYNSNLGTFHTDGKFSQTNISVTFQEEKTLTRKDIEAGF